MSNTAPKCEATFLDIPKSSIIFFENCGAVSSGPMAGLQSPFGWLLITICFAKSNARRLGMFVTHGHSGTDVFHNDSKQTWHLQCRFHSELHAGVLNYDFPICDMGTPVRIVIITKPACRSELSLFISLWTPCAFRKISTSILHCGCSLVSASINHVFSLQRALRIQSKLDSILITVITWLVLASGIHAELCQFHFNNSWLTRLATVSKACNILYSRLGIFDFLGAASRHFTSITRRHTFLIKSFILFHLMITFILMSRGSLHSPATFVRMFSWYGAQGLGCKSYCWISLPINRFSKDYLILTWPLTSHPNALGLT